MANVAVTGRRLTASDGASARPSGIVAQLLRHDRGLGNLLDAIDDQLLGRAFRQARSDRIDHRFRRARQLAADQLISLAMDDLISPAPCFAANSAKYFCPAVMKASRLRPIVFSVASLTLLSR